MNEDFLCRSFRVVGMGERPYSDSLVFGSPHHGRADISISVNAETYFYEGVQAIITKGSLRFGPGPAIT